MMTKKNPDPAASVATVSAGLRHPLLVTLIIAGGAMICGGLIYLLCRPVLPLFLRWMETPGGGGVISSTRAVTVPLAGELPALLVYSLPQGLWAFSYAMVITALWSKPGRNGAERLFWLASVPLVPLGFEWLQHTGIIAGVCSRGDLVFSLAGILSGALCGWFRRIR